MCCLGTGLSIQPRGVFRTQRQDSSEMSSTQDFKNFAYISEFAARNMEVPRDELDSEHDDCWLYTPTLYDDCKASYKNIASKIKYMKSKAASSKWTTEFVHKLSRTMCMRRVHIDENTMTKCWPSGQCVACKRPECKNLNALQLFGYAEECDEPFGDMERVNDDYTSYVNHYVTVLEDGHVFKKGLLSNDSFHPQDGGIAIVGETCANRMLFYHLANNFVYEWCGQADSFLRTKRANNEKIKPDTMYASNTDDIERIQCSFMELLRMSVRETEHVPSYKIPYDDAYWGAVEKIRRNWCVGRRIDMLHNSVLRCNLAWGEVESDDSDESDESDDSDTSLLASQTTSATKPVVKHVVTTLGVSPCAASKRRKIVSGLSALKDKLILEADTDYAIVVLEAIAELQRS